MITISIVITQDIIQREADRITDIFGLSGFEVSLIRGERVRIDKFVVPDAERGNGVGSKAMEAFLEFVDPYHKIMSLSPANHRDGIGTTSTARLIQFYRNFGFVPNKGKNKVDV